MLNYDAKPMLRRLTPDLRAYHAEIFKPTTLHSACYNNNVPALIGELDEGADIDATNNRYGVRPLHVAVIKGYVDVVRALLESGADVFATDTNGRTALHLACLRGHVEIVRILRLSLFDPPDDQVMAAIDAQTAECLSWEGRIRISTARP